MYNNFVMGFGLIFCSLDKLIESQVFLIVHFTVLSLVFLLIFQQVKPKHIVT